MTTNYSAYVSKEDFTAALAQVGLTNSNIALSDPKIYKTTFDLLRIVANPKDPLVVITSLSTALSGARNVSAYTSASSSTQSVLRNASAGMSFFKSTMDWTKVLASSSTVVSGAKVLSPNAILVFATAQVVQKSGIALSLAGGDDVKAKCYGALLELAGSVATTAVLAPTGVGALLAVASLSAASINAHMTCRSVY